MSILPKKSSTLTPVHTVARVVKFLGARGVAVEALLAETGLAAADINVASRMLSVGQEQQVITNALALSSSRVLGLELGLEVRLSAVGILGYAMLSAESFGAGLSVPLRLPALLGTYFDIELATQDGIAFLTITHCRAPAHLQRFLSEVCLSAFKAMAEDMLYGDVPLSHAFFAYTVEPDVEPHYRRGFGCDVLFGQRNSGIAFPCSLLKQKLRLADAACHSSTLEICYAHNRDLAVNREWLEKLRSVISSNLRSPPSLDELSQLLHCSSRTLRRQLELQNTSYRALLDELRFMRAKEFLREGELNIENIAEELGFSDSAGLRRAFRRWSGHSPKTFRS